MTTSKKTAAKRVASQPQDRRAPAPDLEAIRSAVREALNDLDPTRGVDLKLTMAHGDRLTSLHSGIESAAARVHNILARLEA